METIKTVEVRYNGLTAGSIALNNSDLSVFEDSLPDGWGRLLLDRYMLKTGVNPDKLSLLQRLALTGLQGRGALEYLPDKSLSNQQGYPDFDRFCLKYVRI